MKKVVILSAFLSPFRSGAEAMVEEVAKRLSKKYDITIVTSRLRSALPKEELLDGTNVRIIRVGRGSKNDKFLFPFLAMQEVRRLKPAVVHAVLESYAGIALVFVKSAYPRAKRILTLQSTNTDTLLGPMHRSAQRLTAISQTLVKRAKKYTNTKVELIPNGIDLKAIVDSVAFHERMPGRILFVGRLEPMKGVDTLIRAFADVYRTKDAKIDKKSLHLRIVGSGSETAKLKALTRELKLQDHVTFVGQLSPVKVYDEYAQAEIFCGLSRSEALGNVFLEAQAAGCAVVTTNIGGIPEIVDHAKTGILLPPDDPKTAAAAIRRLLAEPEFRQKISKAAMAHVKDYDWSVIAQKYAKVWG